MVRKVDLILIYIILLVLPHLSISSRRGYYVVNPSNMVNNNNRCPCTRNFKNYGKYSSCSCLNKSSPVPLNFNNNPYERTQSSGQYPQFIPSAMNIHSRPTYALPTQSSQKQNTQSFSSLFNPLLQPLPPAVHSFSMPSQYASFMSLPKRPEIKLPYPTLESPPTKASLDPLFPMIKSAPLPVSDPYQDIGLHLPPVYSLYPTTTTDLPRVIEGENIKESKNCVCDLLQSKEGKVTYHCRCKEPAAPGKLMADALKVLLLKKIELEDKKFQSYANAQENQEKSTTAAPITTSIKPTTIAYTYQTVPFNYHENKVDKEYYYNDHFLANDKKENTELPRIKPCIMAFIQGIPHCACEEDYIQCGETECCYKDYLIPTKSKIEEKTDKAFELITDVLKRINHHLKQN